jgi:hypothetical protein
VEYRILEKGMIAGVS